MTCRDLSYFLQSEHAVNALPQADPARRLARFGLEIEATLKRVIAGGRYILGPEVERFEAAFAAYVGVSHCVGVGCGTDALALALKTLGAGPGDEVITVALTAAGTAQAILLCGARPIFVDVNPHTRCIDPHAAEAAITTRTAAIVPVHLFGLPADMHAIMAIAERHGIPVLEDCAHAHGATIGDRKVGSFGHAAAFSFYPTKNLGGIGDGGAVVCDDPVIATRVRALRSYGCTGTDRISRVAAGNSRLDEIQAAVLSVLLQRLDEVNVERRSFAASYYERLSGLNMQLPPKNSGAVYHQFAPTCEGRDELRLFLARENIGTAVHYDPPLHLHPAFSKNGALFPLPATEKLSNTLVSLPIQPEVIRDHLDAVAMAIRKWGKQ